MRGPCLDCEYRRINCHGYCRSYKEYKDNRKTKDLREQEYLRYMTGAKGAYNRMRVKRGVMRI